MMKRNCLTLICLGVMALLTGLNPQSSVAQDVTSGSLNTDKLVVDYITDSVKSNSTLENEFRAFHADKNAQDRLHQQLEAYLGDDPNWANKTAKLIKIIDDEFERIEKNGAKEFPWPLCLRTSQCEIPKQNKTTGIQGQNPVAKLAIEYMAVLLESTSSDKPDVFKAAAKLIRENQQAQGAFQKALEEKLGGSRDQEGRAIKALEIIRDGFERFKKLRSKDHLYDKFEEARPQFPAAPTDFPPVPWPLCIFWKGC